MENNDFAALGRPAPKAQLFHQQAILELETRQHRSGRDVAGLDQKLAYPQGHGQGQQQAAPEGPWIFRLFFPFRSPGSGEMNPGVWCFDSGGMGLGFLRAQGTPSGRSGFKPE
jgi:hypothetical protein